MKAALSPGKAPAFLPREPRLHPEEYLARMIVWQSHQTRLNHLAIAILVLGSLMSLTGFVPEFAQPWSKTPIGQFVVQWFLSFACLVMVSKERVLRWANDTVNAFGPPNPKDMLDFEFILRQHSDWVPVVAKWIHKNGRLEHRHVSFLKNNLTWASLDEENWDAYERILKHYEKAVASQTPHYPSIEEMDNTALASHLQALALEEAGPTARSPSCPRASRL